MSNAKKIIDDRKLERKPREQRSRNVKVNLDLMFDGIVDGKLVVPVKGRVFFERNTNGKIKLHEGFVFEVDGNSVTIFDETREQMYLINTTKWVGAFKTPTKPEVASVPAAGDDIPAT